MSEETTQEGEAQQRPDWLPDKFGSVEQMATAYRELEKRLSSGGTAPKEQPQENSQEEPSPEASPEEGAESLKELEIGEADKDNGDWLEAFSQEFRENGSLSEESYKKLNGRGLSQKFVDSFIAGQKALVQQQTAQVFAAVGGKDEYARVIDWARQNLSEAEIKSFNDMVMTQSIDQAKLAVLGLKARRDAAVGSRPRMQRGTGNAQQSARVEPFENINALVQAQKDPRYATSQKYRDEVAQRLAASNLS